MITAERWRVVATWPAQRYGLATPFDVPATWQHEGAGTDLQTQVRDQAWWTPEQTLHTTTEQIAAIERPDGVRFSYSELDLPF